MGTYTITTGVNRMDKNWKVKAVSWEQMVDRLSKPVVTKETMAQYASMSKKDKTAVKDVGGFVGGPMVHEGERKNSNIHERSLITIDIDGDGSHIPNPDVIKEQLEETGWLYAMHSTHSSTPDWPRLRIVLPMSRIANEDEFSPVALKVAALFGFDIVDQTTVQKARIMFWPSISRDAEYIFASGGRNPVNVDAVLESYVDWRNAAEWPGENSAALRAQRRKGVTGTMGSGKVNDPTAKGGLIGAFCKVFSIDDAIEEFGLPYKKAKAGRYTYAGGSTYGGAITYEDGRFLFSNHNTDPASGQLCNAFDLVRIHLFGDEDWSKGPETPVNRLPSYKKMSELANGIKEVRQVLVKQTLKAFDDIQDTESAPEAPKAPAGSPEAKPVATAPDPAALSANDWLEELDTNSSGSIKGTPHNFALIFKNDNRIKERLQKDVFANRKNVTAAMPWDMKGMEYPREYTDTDMAELQLYFSERWGIHNGKDALAAVVEVELSRRSVHPVREWLRNLPEWDGRERADRLFIDYLGAPDTELNRAITRKHLCAAIKRVMVPGCKYDQVLVLAGPEGTGKSSIIEAISNGWFMDSGIPVGDKDAYQNLPGHWLIEMGELSDYETKSSAVYKNFISSQVDRYRPAYGRETISVPRQCVFFGTTNENGFLKGKTGNRRFWIIECPGNPDMLPLIFDGSLKEELPQLWAEVKHYYDEGEQLTLDAELRLDMKRVQEGFEGILKDDNKEIIREFILMPKPAGWEAMSIQDRRDWYHGRNSSADGLCSLGAIYLHEHICVKEISLVVFGQQLSSKSRYEDDNLYYICDHLDCLRKTDTRFRFGKELGQQRCYDVVREDLPF